MAFRNEAAERQGPDIEVELGAQSASQLYADLGGTIVGVFASTFLVLDRDAHVGLIISFPDRKGIRAAGVVQFVRTAGPDQLPGLGVAFTEISADDREIVAQFAANVRAPMLYDE
ncbi:MAG: hypothetical protein KF819_11580 [Labilithrix sp.]|nr:hypothetical protein [Labilithrix sp.]